MKNRKVPLRKCIVTNEMKPKKELIRIVRSPEGEVSLDLSGKKNGRGAYITNGKEYFELAKKKDILSKQLQISVSPETYDQLELEREQGAKS
ncbi:RNase P modulator RnpM [Alkalihalobacillus pseudalcaliphilus]|uniref:RNase P modulator RnpM n=1 Tax=Alkalihalobacillus pseudalcaliphilus TaxID=79884 RepID=UPI00064E0707|nr:YlxR family protein [Alkalihalobacillus pseudalcaliphilus]KMK77251.1 RNA-binding protein [Alkalihalobacillus pseudalcaliphilus]